MAKKRVRKPVTIYGQWVYQQLTARNMTVKELGEYIGVYPQNISNYLHGSDYGYSYRDKIETILGEPPTEIKYSHDNLAG